MPRTITCTTGILRGAPDAFPGTSVRRQRGAREGEEPDREQDRGADHRDDQPVVQAAAGAGGGPLAAHGAQPGGRLALVLDAARQPAVRAVEVAEQLAD